MGGRGTSLRQRQTSIRDAYSNGYSKPLTSHALPKLEGSEKQIEWANEIRKRYVQAYNWSIEHSQKDPLYDKLGLRVADRVYVMMQEGAIKPKDVRAGSTADGKSVSTSWAKNLKIEKMPMFYWEGHDDLTRNMKRYRQDAIDSWVQHTRGESKAHSDMMNAREKAINDFYKTANKEFTSKITIMDDNAMAKMTKDQRKAARKKNADIYYRFLRKYARKTLLNNTSASWWIDNFK